MVIIQDKSQWFSIEISDSHMEVFVKIHDVPSFPLSSTMLLESLQQHGIVYGIDMFQLSRLVQHTEECISTPILIAAGIPPVHGQDGYIRYTFPDLTRSGPVEQSDGSVDYREVNHLNNVHKDDLIAECIPPNAGKPGMNVFGQVIPGKDGRPARFKMGKNVVTDSEGIHLYAAIDGLVTVTEGDRINVFAIYEVTGDIDYHVGNIDFVGSVVIRGNVLPGFRVTASGNIRVTGNVEAADLKAGGSIEVGTGIVGHTKSRIEAGKDIRTPYIYHANVISSDNIIVGQSIHHSIVKAGNSVICNGPKGGIVGGYVQAGNRIEARNIGNAMSTPTTVEVGVLPEIRDRWVILNNQLKELQDNKVKAKQAHHLLRQLARNKGSLSAEKQALMEKMDQSITQYDLQEQELESELFQLEQALEQAGQGSIRAYGTLYSSVKIVVGKKVFFTHTEISRVEYKLVDGHIGTVSI